MRTRTHDLYYNKVRERFGNLTAIQKANAIQRMRIKAVVSRSTFLMALDSCIDIELSGRSPLPTPCPPITSQEAKFAELLRGACSVYGTLHTQPHF